MSVALPKLKGKKIVYFSRYIYVLSKSTIFFTHYLTKVGIFEEKLCNIKCVFCFFLQYLSKTFLILKRIQWDIIKNVLMSSFFMQSIHYSRQILVKLEFLDRVSKNPEMSYFNNIRPIEADLFHTERRAERNDKVNNGFSLV